MVFGVALGAARRHRSHALLDDLLHTIQRLLNLRTIGDLPGVEFVPAQPTGQIRPELKLPQPDFERLPTAGAGQINPCAPVIFEQAVTSG